MEGNQERSPLESNFILCWQRLYRGRRRRSPWTLLLAVCHTLPHM